MENKITFNELFKVVADYITTDDVSIEDAENAVLKSIDLYNESDITGFLDWLLSVYYKTDEDNAEEYITEDVEFFFFKNYSGDYSKSAIFKMIDKFCELQYHLYINHDPEVVDRGNDADIYTCFFTLSAIPNLFWLLLSSAITDEFKKKYTKHLKRTMRRIDEKEDANGFYVSVSSCMAKIFGAFLKDDAKCSIEVDHAAELMAKMGFGFRTFSMYMK